METCTVLSLSECLSLHPGCALWLVKSVHDEYLNVSTPEGLITLVKSGTPLVPFGLEVDLKENWHIYGIRANQPVFQYPDQIIVGGVLGIMNYSQSPRFLCHPQFDSEYDKTELSRRLDILYQRCVQTKKHGGILTYLRKNDPWNFWVKRNDFTHCSQEKVCLRFDALVQGIYSNKDDLIYEGVCGLLGVGQGLTPSGDDFLLGFLCGLRDIGIGRCLTAAEKMAVHLVENASSRTTSLSAEYIKYGVKGFYHQLLVEFIESFNMASKSDMLIKADKLMNLGHFSGTDLMTGFVYGGLIALHAVSPDAYSL